MQKKKGLCHDHQRSLKVLQLLPENHQHTQRTMSKMRLSCYKLPIGVDQNHLPLELFPTYLIFKAFAQFFQTIHSAVSQTLCWINWICTSNRLQFWKKYFTLMYWKHTVRKFLFFCDKILKLVKTSLSGNRSVTFHYWFCKCLERAQSKETPLHQNCITVKVPQETHKIAHLLCKFGIWFCFL